MAAIEEYSGSAGDLMEVGAPDTDNEVEFTIYSTSRDVEATAYLGAEARQRLIRQLRDCTPE